jgi:hypothetical protein
MGILKSYLTNKVIDDLKSKGLCVWLDVNEDYSQYIAELKEQHNKGRFEFPILSFSGSFLEIMLELDEYFSSKQNKPLLIHVPNFNQQSLRRTPLLEAYKAGKEIQINLKALIRNAAAGKLAPEQLEFLLNDDQLTLEKADKRLTTEDQTPAGLKSLIATHSADEIAIDVMISGNLIDKIELPEESRFEALFQYLQLHFGITKEWIREWEHDPDLIIDYPSIKTPLQAYILGVEYVFDLKENPIDNRLRPLKSLPQKQSQQNCQVVRKLRENKPELYKKIAQGVELQLVGEANQNAEKLGNVDTFPFEEEMILSLAYDYMAHERWEDISSLVQQRRGKKSQTKKWNSFWVEHNESHRWAWRWLEQTSLLRQKLAKDLGSITNLDAKKVSPEKLLELYSQKNGFFKIDQLHREFDQLTSRLQMQTSIPNFTKVTKEIKNTKTVYREFINKLTRLFSTSCKNHGFLPNDQFQQRHFFKQVVEPLVTQDPVVVFFIDAFRYELGEVLMQRLQEDKGKCDLSARMAELPTITPVGMNALLPIESNDRLTPAFDKKKGKFIGFKSGEKLINGPTQRKKLLESISDHPVKWTSPKEIIGKPIKTLKSHLKNSKLVIVHSLDIDEAGETGLLNLAPDFFENAINRLLITVNQLQKVGYKQFVFTSDHGFLQADETLGGEAVYHVDVSTRRYILNNQPLAETDKTTSVSFSELGYESDSDQNYLTFSTIGDLFQAPSNNDFYYHGGNSLQERVIPVLTYFKNNPTIAGDETTIKISVKASQMVMGFHRIYVQAKINGTIPFFANDTVNLELSIHNQAKANIVIGEVISGTYVGNNIKIPLGKEVEVCFKILGENETKAQLCLSQIENLNAEKYITKEHFQVELQKGVNLNATEKPSAPIETEDSGTWSGKIDPKFFPILDHLKKHGALTEQSLVNMCGGPGKGSRMDRRFALKLIEWEQEKLLPFKINITSTSEGKEYRIF